MRLALLLIVLGAAVVGGSSGISQPWDEDFGPDEAEGQNPIGNGSSTTRSELQSKTSSSEKSASAHSTGTAATSGYGMAGSQSSRFAGTAPSADVQEDYLRGYQEGYKAGYVQGLKDAYNWMITLLEEQLSGSADLRGGQASGGNISR